MSDRFNRARLRLGFRVWLGELVMIAVAVLALSGCGASWSLNARHGIEVAAIATDVGDGILAHAIHEDCGPLVEHLEAGSDERRHVADLCLADHHFDAAAAAVAVADHALRAAQAAVDAAERAGSSAIWEAAAPQLTRAWCELDVALGAAGIHLPAAILVPLTALVPVAGTCRPPTTDAP